MQKKPYKILGIPVFYRNIHTGRTDNPTEKLINALNGTVGDAGVPITTETAITISAVWRAINVVSGTLAFLPLQVFRKNEGKGREHLADHYVQQLLKKPTRFSSDYIFRQTMHATRMLYGNAYAMIIRENGRPVELKMIHPDDVMPLIVENELVYRIRSGNIVEEHNMIHLRGLSLDGVMGKSPIAVQRESFGLSKAAEKFGARFFGSGTKNSGIIEVPGSLGDTAYKNLKNSWDEAFRGLDNSHGTPILEAGATYRPISIPPEDAQFLQTRKFQIEEIARWYGVQPHILMDLERSTNNNIEHQGMEFVTYTLSTEIAMWESELNDKLFTKTEKTDHYLEFNITALLRGDSKARSDFYRGMFAVGAISPNRIRELENLPPYEGGDRHYVQAGFVPTDKIDNVYEKNTTNEKTTNPPA